MKWPHHPLIIATCWSFIPAGIAAEKPDAVATELRKELEALRSDYEARIARLEERLAQLEQAPVAVPPSPLPASPARPLNPDPSPVASSQAPLPTIKPATSPPAGDRAEAAGIDESLELRNRVRESFRDTTETRDFGRRPDIEETLNQRLEEVLEGYIDISGYFRAGYGRSDGGGPQRAFGLPGVARYRLGNEAENYGELAFSKTFFNPGSFSLLDPTGDINGPVAQMNLRMSFFNPYENNGSGADTEFALPELWASVGNILPGRPEAKFWAGSRFYRRHDIHINDFFFWDMSGGGAGIEDFELGPGKWAFAWIGDGAESVIYDRVGTPDPDNTAGFSKTSFDLRYYDWRFLGGIGEVGLTYSIADSGVDALGNQAEDAHGVALSLVRTREGFLDEQSIHKSSLQLGFGPAKTFTAGFDTFTDATGTFIRPDPNESWRLRLTDHWIVKPWQCVSLGTAFIYQYTDFGANAPEQHWVSAGLRPIWHLNEWASLAFEGGFDWISESPNGHPGSLGKITLAPQVALGDQFYSRPVLRAFITYALWNDGMQGAVGGPEHRRDTSGFSWGVQMESWW